MGVHVMYRSVNGEALVTSRIVLCTGYDRLYTQLGAGWECRGYSQISLSLPIN